MSLLDDVSIVVTPNGYKAGELYAVMPVPTEGVELVTNGEFTTDLSGWDNGGTGTSVWDTGRAKLTTTGTGYIKPISAITTVVGLRYEFLVTLTGTGNTANVRAGTSSLGVDLLNSGWGVTDGSHIYYFVATSTTTYIAVGNGSASVSYIDNVSVKEVTSADMDVTRATAATRVDEDGLVNYAEIIGGEEAPSIASIVNVGGGTITQISGNSYSSTSDGTSGSGIRPKFDFNTTAGKRYKLTITPTGTISGTINFKFYDGSSYLFQNYDFTTTKEIYFIDNGSVFGAFDGTQTYSVASFTVSVKEVTRDNVPRIDYTGGGCPHILAEPMSTNLITYSEDFEGSGWSHFRGTITPNSIISPDGTLNASRYEEDIQTGAHMFRRQGLSLTNGLSYTGSIFAKKGELTSISLQSNSSSRWVASATFDLENGLVTSGTGIIENYQNDWYKCSISGNAVQTTSDAGLEILTSSGVGRTGDGLYMWGAQFEEGSYATSYIPTSGSTVTRNQDIFTRDGIGSLINSTEGGFVFRNGCSC